MNDANVNNMTTEEILRYADRSDPVINSLCKRLETAINHMREISKMVDGLKEPIQAE